MFEDEFLGFFYLVNDGGIVYNENRYWYNYGTFELVDVLRSQRQIKGYWLVPKEPPGPIQGGKDWLINFLLEAKLNGASSQDINRIANANHIRIPAYY